MTQLPPQPQAPPPDNTYKADKTAHLLRTVRVYGSHPGFPFIEELANQLKLAAAEIAGFSGTMNKVNSDSIMYQQEVDRKQRALIELSEATKGFPAARDALLQIALGAAEPADLARSALTSIGVAIPLVAAKAKRAKKPTKL